MHEIILDPVLAPVDLFQIRFPRYTLKEALELVLKDLRAKRGNAICFPDMSTLNLVYESPYLRKVITEQFLPLNDGTGLSFAAWLEKKPFPANLNGTDFVPKVLEKAPSGTKVFLIGGAAHVAERTAEKWQKTYPHLNFVGAANGFETPKMQRADLILVGMGNPKQLEFIQEYRKNPEFDQTVWLAVGGLFDFYGGTRVRAPKWMIDLRLEWLHILSTEPHKLKRYLLGIPLFLYRATLTWLKGEHRCK